MLASDVDRVQRAMLPQWHASDWSSDTCAHAWVLMHLDAHACVLMQLEVHVRRRRIVIDGCPNI